MKRFRIFSGFLIFNIEEDVKDPDFYFSLFWRRFEIFKYKGYKTNVFDVTLFQRIIYRLGN